MFWSIFVWVGSVFCAIQRNWMTHPRKTDAKECSAQAQTKNLWFLGKIITWTFDLRFGSIPWRDIRVRIWHWYISVWRGRRGPPVSWCRRCYGIQPQATWQNGHEWTQQYLLSLGKRRATRCCHGMRIFTILAGIFWLYYSIKKHTKTIQKFSKVAENLECSDLPRSISHHFATFLWVSFWQISLSYVPLLLSVKRHWRVQFGHPGSEWAFGSYILIGGIVCG